MLRSSLGFHTITLILYLEVKEFRRLIQYFLKYREATKLIVIFQVDGKGNYSIYKPSSNSLLLPIHLVIKYRDKEDRGIKWETKCNYWNDEFKSYSVEATINPKVLGDIHDYITAATYNDMEGAITNFNLEAKRISPLLKSFDFYSINRIDYCINFDINELVTGCSPEQAVDLIKRADIPPYYEEWTEYDETAHRMKSKLDSFYLINPSVNINCYSKFMSLQDRSKKRESKGRSPIPQTILDSAHGIIRFEVQCKYHRTYTLSKRAEVSGNTNINKYESLLNYVTCVDEISHYFNKVIGKGDWYTRKEAIHIIESKHYNKQREKRLIEALQFVSRCRSLAKAKATYPHDLEVFKRTLKELSALNINPVTIPKEWGIKHIPNLLYTYHDKVQRENLDKEVEKLQSDCLEEYIKEFGCLPA